MIVGFNIRKIDVERKKKLVQGMKVKYNMDISKVHAQELPLTTSKHRTLGFDFEYSVEYEPGIANVNILGTVNYLLPEEEAQKVLDSWKKTKKLPKNVSVPVINVILDKCTIKALELEQDLGLPTHLPMPSVNVGDKSSDKDAEKYIG